MRLHRVILTGLAPVILLIFSVETLASTVGSPIPLYPGLTLYEKRDAPVEGTQEIFGQKVIVNVRRPTVTPVLPDPAKSNGAAVIIAPGGAFKMVSIDSEGLDVARWLSGHGIACFVLKYRLDPSPADPAEFKKDFMSVMAKITAGGLLASDHQQSVADEIAAIKLVRSHAAEWHVDPAKVGALGFSAGAVMTLATVLAADHESRPDFAGVIYGAMLPVAVPPDAPPLFIALAANDPLFGRRGLGLVDSWLSARRPVEFHLYEKGGHGFGMKHMGTSSDGWIDDFYRWVEARGLLKTR